MLAVEDASALAALLTFGQTIGRVVAKYDFIAHERSSQVNITYVKEIPPTTRRADPSMEVGSTVDYPTSANTTAILAQVLRKQLDRRK
jgi:hypothetical protein